MTHEEEIQAQAYLEDILENSDFSDINLLIATPCYGGQVTEPYFQSMLHLTKLLLSANIEHTVFTISNESLITRARNSIVANFLAQERFTHLMFIDADIEFQPLAAIRLLQAAKPVCGGCYPTKAFHWERIKELCANPDITEREIRSGVLNHLIYPHQASAKDGEPMVKLENGFMKVDHIATGFILIERDVFTKMKQAYPDDRYVNDISGYKAAGDHYWLFFDAIKDPDSGRYLSEDYAFCKKWTDIGGELWIDLLSPLTHIGTFKFEGDVYEAIKDQLMI